MSYYSGNQPDSGSDPRAAKGQRSPYLQDDATDVYDNSGYSRGPQGGAAPRQGRQPSWNSSGSRAGGPLPRSRPRTAAPRSGVNPVAVLAIAASAIAVILAIALIVVLLRRNDSPAPAPTQGPAVIPTQPPITYQTPPPTATVVVTPSPEPLPVTIQTPAPTLAPTPAPTPVLPVTAEPGRSYTSAGVLADARAAAERDSHYSTVSEKDVELEIPADSAFLRTPFLKKAYAGEDGKAIYIMPRPIPGNGTLGTVVQDETVTVLAENEYYYFFVTRDGRAGWNGKSFFRDP